MAQKNRFFNSAAIGKKAQWFGDSHYTGTEKLETALEKYKDYIMDETLALSLKNEETKEMVSDNLNGEDIKFYIEKAN